MPSWRDLQLEVCWSVTFKASSYLANWETRAWNRKNKGGCAGGTPPIHSTSVFPCFQSPFLPEKAGQTWGQRVNRRSSRAEGWLDLESWNTVSRAVKIRSPNPRSGVWSKHQRGPAKEPKLVPSFSKGMKYVHIRFSWLMNIFVNFPHRLSVIPILLGNQLYNCPFLCSSLFLLSSYSVYRLSVIASNIIRSCWVWPIPSCPLLPRQLVNVALVFHS